MRRIWTGALCLLVTPAALAAQGSGEDREKAALDRICAASTEPDADARDQNILSTLGTALLLGDDQKAKLRDYRDAQAKAVADARLSLCERKPDLSALQGALEFRKAMAQAQLDALNAASAKLLDFYNSLNPEQRAKFDSMRANFGRRSGP
jgi:Spy/CpxP family protein refolding chaperone